MATPAIQTLITDAQQVLNLKSLSEIRATMAAALANANVGTPLNPNLTTQQLWDQFYLIVRQPESDIESIITNQLMKFLFAPPAPGGVGGNHEVIYNNNGVLAGDPKFLWDPALNKLDIDGSATITGDLTVRTNKLAVTSSGVGFGTTTPAYPAHFRTTSPVIAIQDDTSAATGVGGVMNFLGFTSGTSGANIFAQIKGVKTAGSAGGEYQVFTSDSAGNSIQRYLIDSTGISTWSVAGTTAMTLNSTGLGVGGSPNTGLLTVGATTNVSATANALTILSQRASFLITANGATDAAGTTINYAWVNGGQGPLIFRNAAIANVMTLDPSGNVGIGVTPVSKLTVSGGVSLTSAASNHFLRDGTAWIWSSDGASTGTARGGLYADGSSNLNMYGGSTLASHLQINSSGDVISKVNTSVPTVANSQMVFNLTTNTNLRITVRGTDGTLRSANITLAP
jgi:hypothetical protein